MALNWRSPSKTCSFLQGCTFLLLLLSCPAASAQKWKHYPLELEHNAELTFPQVEGPQYQYMGDSWFLTAEVEGQHTGKKYQIVTIFDRNFIVAVALNFYQTSIFDYETGDFNTFTEYDLPGVSLLDMHYSGSAGSLDIAFNSSAGNATWATQRDAAGDLIPFVQTMYCPATDHITGSPFSFRIDINTQKKPVAYGASTLRGFFEFYGQKNTFSYWQPAPAITGNLTFKGVTEPIKGTKGHMDRQIFPLYSGIDTPSGRQHSHEWRQINLDHGFDLAIWRQFDRVNNNTLVATTGSTVSPGNTHEAPLWVDGLPTDLTVEYISYAKYPRGTFNTLIPPPSQNMYMPSEHIIRSKGLQLELHGVYVAPVPAVTLPIEYFEGPMRWNGSIAGKPVSGIGIFESTLALYRDWELAEVLVNTAKHLPTASFAKKQSRSAVVQVLQTLAGIVSDNPLLDHRVQARAYLKSKVLPALQSMTGEADRATMLEIADDFKKSLLLVAQF